MLAIFGCQSATYMYNQIALSQLTRGANEHGTRPTAPMKGVLRVTMLAVYLLV